MNIETNEQYHSNDAISHSKLELFRRRPISYYRRFVGKTLARPEATEAFRIGSAAHCAVLEPDTFYARYAMRPEGIDRRTKDGKAAFAQFEAENAGKVVIGSDELGDVREMAAAVAHHPLASQLLAAGKPELTWRVEPKGSLALQCRTDWFNPTGCELSGWRPYVADLKTVESLDSDAFRNFERACFSFGYHRQAGFYLPLITEILGGPVFDFFFVAVEKVEPFGVAVYRLSDAAIARGQDETITDLVRLQSCIASNVWPNLDPALREIGLPKWYGGGAE
jgi:exodeoxyribonuclease VIII